MKSLPRPQYHRRTGQLVKLSDAGFTQALPAARLDLRQPYMAKVDGMKQRLHATAI